MNNYLKIIIILGIIVIVGVGSWLYFVSYQNIKTKFLEERKNDITVYLRDRANQLAIIDYFNVADSGLQGQIFKSFFEEIQSSEIFRIKVFSRDYKIVWSNLKEIIGQDASSNQDLKDVLASGKIILKTKSVKPEQVTERRFQNFTETYVPIANGNGEYVGVVEIYQTYVALGKKINKEFISEAMKIIIGAIIVFIALALIIRRLMPRQI